MSVKFMVFTTIVLINQLDIKYINLYSPQIGVHII